MQKIKILGILGVVLLLTACGEDEPAKQPDAASNGNGACGNPISLTSSATAIKSSGMFSGQSGTYFLREFRVWSMRQFARGNNRRHPEQRMFFVGFGPTNAEIQTNALSGPLKLYSSSSEDGCFYSDRNGPLEFLNLRVPISVDAHDGNVVTSGEINYQVSSAGRLGVSNSLRFNGASYNSHFSRLDLSSFTRTFVKMFDADDTKLDAEDDHRVFDIGAGTFRIKGYKSTEKMAAIELCGSRTSI